MSLPAAAPAEPRRRWVLATSILVAVVLLVRLPVPAHWPALPLNDFAQYWAAARQTLQGDNPYDPIGMTQQEHRAGRDGDVLMMFNPPWTLTVAMPFGLLEPRAAYLAWMTLLASALGSAAVLLWRHYGGSHADTGAALLIACTFVPTFLSLFLAQIAPLLLLGAALFLVAQRRGRLMLAGAAANLMLIKPHLTYLFWIAFLLWSIERRHWPALAGAMLTGLVTAVVPLFWNPNVWWQYRDFFLHHPPAQYSSPTLGTVLRYLLDPSDFRLQYLAMVPGLAWLGVHYARRRATWDWGREMPWLLFMSLLTAAYGAWPFDLMLLLVPVLQVAATARERARTLAAFHVAFNGLAGGMVASLVHFLWFFWMTPVLLAAYVLAIRKPSSFASSEPEMNVRHAPAVLVS